MRAPQDRCHRLSHGTFLVYSQSAWMRALHSCSISTESESALSNTVQMQWIGSYLGHAAHFRVSPTRAQVNVFGKQLFVILNKRNMRKHRK